MAKWRPSRTKAREFAQQMARIEQFCKENKISKSGGSYYFGLNGQRYRVSNHSVEASDRGAFRDGVQVRDKYHNGRSESVVYIHASQLRIEEIYNNLLAGRRLDGRGNVV